MLLSWHCKICMIWIGQLINICLCLTPVFSLLPNSFSSHLPFSSLLPQSLLLQHYSRTHIQYSDTHILMNCVWEWRSVLRPCWGAADWSCTDLPQGPWRFITHVCGAGLNTFSHSVSLSLSLSVSPVTRASSLCSAVALMLPHLSPSISLSIRPITGSLCLSLLIFSQFCLHWLTLSF